MRTWFQFSLTLLTSPSLLFGFSSRMRLRGDKFAIMSEVSLRFQSNTFTFAVIAFSFIAIKSSFA